MFYLIVLLTYNRDSIILHFNLKQQYYLKNEENTDYYTKYGFKARNNICIYFLLLVSDKEGITMFIKHIQFEREKKGSHPLEARSKTYGYCK